MFKVSDLNPNDRTLDEIHEIQKQIYEEEKELSWEEIRHRLKATREEFCKTYKCRFSIISLEKSQLKQNKIQQRNKGRSLELLPFTSPPIPLSTLVERGRYGVRFSSTQSVDQSFAVDCRPWTVDILLNPYTYHPSPLEKHPGDKPNQHHPKDDQTPFGEGGDTRWFTLAGASLT